MWPHRWPDRKCRSILSARIQQGHDQVAASARKSKVRSALNDVALNLGGPGPTEVRHGFELIDLGEAQAPFQSAVSTFVGFGLHHVFENLARRPPLLRHTQSAIASRTASRRSPHGCMLLRRRADLPLAGRSRPQRGSGGQFEASRTSPWLRSPPTQPRGVISRGIGLARIPAATRKEISGFFLQKENTVH
jgi:hypothetical protein